MLAYSKGDFVIINLFLSITWSLNYYIFIDVFTDWLIYLLIDWLIISKIIIWENLLILQPWVILKYWIMIHDWWSIICLIKWLTEQFINLDTGYFMCHQKVIFYELINWLLDRWLIAPFIIRMLEIGFVIFYNLEVAFKIFCLSPKGTIF